MGKHNRQSDRIRQDDKNVPYGSTKPLEEILQYEETKHKECIAIVKQSYEDYQNGTITCRSDYFLPDDWERCSLEERLERIDANYRRKIRYIKRNYMRRTCTKDNQTYYNTKGGGSNPSKIRVPSLKRSNRVWRNFYNLFPFLKGAETYHGLKLKQIK